MDNRQIGSEQLFILMSRRLDHVVHDVVDFYSGIDRFLEESVCVFWIAGPLVDQVDDIPEEVMEGFAAIDFQIGVLHKHLKPKYFMRKEQILEIDDYFYNKDKDSQFNMLVTGFLVKRYHPVLKTIGFKLLLHVEDDVYDCAHALLLVDVIQLDHLLVVGHFELKVFRQNLLVLLSHFHEVVVHQGLLQSFLFVPYL